MSVLKDCLDNVVAITRRQVLCLPDAPIEFYEPRSGLYIEDIPGMNLRWINETGGAYDLWEKIENTKHTAIKYLKMDLQAELMRRYQPRSMPFTGNIGSQKFKNSLTFNNTFAGVSMYTRQFKAGFFDLKGIGCAFDQDGTIDIEIYDDLDNDPLHVVTIDTLANKYKATRFNETIRLPLWSDNVENTEYYFLYRYDGKQPKNNEVTCGCGGVKWCYNKQSPCFVYKGSKDRWQEYAMIGGVRGNDITKREDWQHTNTMNGLVLIGDFSCDIGRGICNEESDFENNQIDIAIAFALYYKWGALLLDVFLSTDSISRYTMMGREELEVNRAKTANRYKAMIEFVTENYDTTRNDCLVCRPAFGFRKSTQLL